MRYICEASPEDTWPRLLIENIFPPLPSPLGIPYNLSYKKILDGLLVPIMYLLQGNFYNIPNQTHFWNNKKIFLSDLKDFREDWMIKDAGVVGVKRRYWGIIPISHIPILGGWRKKMILKPSLFCKKGTVWHIGWLSDDGVSGVSLIPIETELVSVLLGDKPCKWFAINQEGFQLPLEKVTEVEIGQKEYAKVPLL